MFSRSLSALLIRQNSMNTLFFIKMKAKASYELELVASTNY